jgi:hypothetical protein
MSRHSVSKHKKKNALLLLLHSSPFTRSLPCSQSPPPLIHIRPTHTLT